MKRKILGVVGVAFVLTTLVWAGIYEEQPAEVSTYSWAINANGFEGLLEYAVVNNRVFGTVLGNPIEGYQVGRHVVFYRQSSANQIWTGWISNSSFGGASGRTISGSFSYHGENMYPWHGTNSKEEAPEDKDSTPGGR